MKRLFLFFILATIMGGGSYFAYLKGIDFNEVKDLAKSLMLENLLSKDIEWKTEDFVNDKRFTFDAPSDWRVEKEEDKIFIKNKEGEEIKIYKTDENLLDTEKEKTLTKVSGEEVVIIKGGENGNDQAVISLQGDGYLVIEGNGKTFEKTYKRVDLTPYVSDWKIFGQEEAETIRILNEIDKYLPVISPISTAGSFKAEKALFLKNSSFSYLSYSDGIKSRTVLLNSEELSGELPKVEGYYDFSVEKSGSSWVIIDKDGKSLAVIPSLNSFLKDENGWSSD